MRLAVFTLGLLGLATFYVPIPAADGPATKPAPSVPSQSDVKQAYLGLNVEALHPSLSSQLAGILPKGLGVLVAKVFPDTPAAKAGLQAHDILLSYADQKLYSPDQLTKLVRSDTPGHEVAIAYLRGGKSETCKVKLGERVASAVPEKPHVFRAAPDQRFQEMYEEFKSTHDNAAWEELDGLKLTRVGDKNWRAEIQYRTKEGKQEHKTFEGSREVIRKDIEASKDLPSSEREHLLRALNLQEPVFEFRFPSFPGPLAPDMWGQP